jgi:hypothetical protein
MLARFQNRRSTNEAPGRVRQLHVADGFRLRTWRALQYPVMLVSGAAG